MSLPTIIKSIQTKLEPCLNEVYAYVYFTKLTSWKEKSRLFWHLLSNEEKRYANKFFLEALKIRYIISHGILRILLSYYMNLSPSKIKFYTNKHGKPFLKYYQNIQFNMSYSNDIICYAFTLSHPIGVDVEWQNTVLDIDSVADLALTPAEKKFFTDLKAEKKSLTFYEIWAKKEALIKAMGLGLSYPIDTIDIIHTPSSVPIYLDGKEWYLYPVKELSGYSCAVAIDHKLHKVTCKHIDEKREGT